MKRFPFLCIFILNIIWNSQNISAQRMQVWFDLGIQQTSSSTQFFYSYFNDEGLQIYSQKPANFFNTNIFIRGRIPSTGFGYSAGLGFHRKGYIERGFMEMSGNGHYMLKISKHYIPLFAGLHYRFFKDKKYSLLIGQHIVPELILHPGGLYKTLGFSTRTNVFFTTPYKNHRQFQLGLFYQTALSNYNKTKILALGSNYRPYAFGLSIGYALPLDRPSKNKPRL